MILDRTPINLNEVEEIIKDTPDTEKKQQTEEYLKKFLKTKPEQAKKIKADLDKLDLLKMKREHVIKIVDLLPTDASELNKIFVDISLNEDETNKILEIVKNSK
jgi:DNA-directed RNA polymerase subunit F